MTLRGDCFSSPAGFYRGASWSRSRIILSATLEADHLLLPEAGTGGGSRVLPGGTGKAGGVHLLEDAGHEVRRDCWQRRPPPCSSGTWGRCALGRGNRRRSCGTVAQALGPRSPGAFLGSMSSPRRTPWSWIQNGPSSSLLTSTRGRSRVLRIVHHPDSPGWGGKGATPGTARSWTSRFREVRPAAGAGAAWRLCGPGFTGLPCPITRRRGSAGMGTWAVLSTLPPANPCPRRFMFSSGRPWTRRLVAGRLLGDVAHLGADYGTDLQVGRQVSTSGF